MTEEFSSLSPEEYADLERRLVEELAKPPGPLVVLPPCVWEEGLREERDRARRIAVDLEQRCAEALRLLRESRGPAIAQCDCYACQAAAVLEGPSHD